MSTTRPFEDVHLFLVRGWGKQPGSVWALGQAALLTTGHSQYFRDEMQRGNQDKNSGWPLSTGLLPQPIPYPMRCPKDGNSSDISRHTGWWTSSETELTGKFHFHLYPLPQGTHLLVVQRTKMYIGCANLFIVYYKGVWMRLSSSGKWLLTLQFCDSKIIKNDFLMHWRVHLLFL